MNRTLEHPEDILNFASVQEALASCASDEQQKEELSSVAMTAVSDGLNSSAMTGETPTVDELCDTAVRAIRSHTLNCAVIPEITPERGAELIQVQDLATAVDRAVMDTEEVHKALGRIEGLEFLRRVGDVAIAQMFAEMRNSKKYKGLPYRDTDGNLRHVEDFDEFCRVKLGKSYTRCYELSQNLRTLGPELYESAERIGFRAKDYRALKALPEEDQKIIKDAIASESREEVLDILQDMAARHAEEKKAAKKAQDELQADLEARDKVLQTNRSNLEKVQIELETLKSLPKDDQLELQLEREQEAVKRINDTVIAATAELNRLLVEVDAVLTNDELSHHTKTYTIQSVQMYCEELSANLANHGIPVDFEGMVAPNWIREAAAEDLQQGNTGEVQ